MYFFSSSALPIPLIWRFHSIRYTRGVKKISAENMKFPTAHTHTHHTHIIYDIRTQTRTRERMFIRSCPGAMCDERAHVNSIFERFRPLYIYISGWETRARSPYMRPSKKEVLFISDSEISCRLDSREGKLLLGRKMYV